jgi:methylaspartate ammonia-lyase
VTGPTIESVRAVPTLGGFFFDDQRAIKAGATRDGFDYDGDPATPGFDRVRQPAEAVSVVLELSDGTVATGDCAAVQYSGAGGRDPVFRAERYVPVVESVVAEELEGRNAASFRANEAAVEALRTDGGERLHTAVRYGVSGALLDAAASAGRETMAEVVVDAFGTTPATEPVPVYAQTGDARRENAEKMLLKGVDVLPHGLFNSVEKVGEDGGKLREYLSWLAGRADDLTGAGYEPRFHVDVYGVVGDLFGPPYDRAEVVDYVEDLREAAAPYRLQLEGPMDAGSRADQVAAMAEMRAGLADAGVDVDVVADEWCNTLEDVRAFVDAGAADVIQVKTPDLGCLGRSVEAVSYCDGTDTRAYLGGTCAETDLTARACANVAVATEPIQVLAKPGMGVDEGVMLVENEMRRTLARMG